MVVWRVAKQTAKQIVYTLNQNKPPIQSKTYSKIEKEEESHKSKKKRKRNKSLVGVILSVRVLLFHQADSMEF